ncbi:exodeoxyribonuclease III [Candidatus Riflebacteria bacterium]
MKIISWNVNGIRAIARKGLLNFIEYFSPDILCLQETKAKEEQLDDAILDISNYRSYFHSALRPGYSGVASYTKIKPLAVQFGMGIDRFDCEGRVLVTEYPDFLLYNIYFPNGQKDEARLQYKLDFYESILNNWEKKRKEGKNIICVGDLNTAHQEMDLKHPRENENISGFLRIEREWISKILDMGYVDTFRKLYPQQIKYSWWSMRGNARKANIGWRIDYCLLNYELLTKLKGAFILNDIYGSDHCPVGIDLDI